MGLRVIRRLGCLVRGRRREDRFSARASGEDGFSLVETVMALGLVFTVMLGLLASLSTGIRGLTTGRQQTGATAVAKEVIERFRAVNFGDVGHDLGNDSTLATDDAITVDADGNYLYKPDGVNAEELVGVASPPYAEHVLGPEERDNATYTTSWYVTEVTPAVGDTYRRLTVTVEWENAQYDETAVANQITASTLVSRFGVLSDEVTGVVDVDSGLIDITGTLDGIDLAQAQLFFPLVHTDTDRDLVVETRGLAGSARSSMTLNSGTASGCGQSGSTVTCDGVKAETAADNDKDTTLALQHVVGPLGHVGDSISSGTPLTLSTGSTSSVVSKSSAESCNVSGCTDGIVGDGDKLAYGYDHADGPSSMTADFDAGVTTGNLVVSESAGSATATVDEDPVSGGSLVSSVGNLVVPAIDILTIDSGTPLDYAGAARVSAVSATATAEAGPTASSPTVTGDPITVSVYETTTLGSGYVDISFSPGDTVNETRTATFDVVDLDLLDSITLTTTVTAGSASTSTVKDGTTITKARADLTNWFTVKTQVVIEELGVTLADLTIEVDYGRIGTLAEVPG